MQYRETTQEDYEKLFQLLEKQESLTQEDFVAVDAVEDSPAKKDVSQTTNPAYDRLVRYINTFGVTDEDGYKILALMAEGDGAIYYAVLRVENDKLLFALIAEIVADAQLDFCTQFYITELEDAMDIQFALLLSSDDTPVDAASAEQYSKRSTFTKETWFEADSSVNGYISATQVAELYNASLQMLCEWWDEAIYNTLGFGLKALGFMSYDGYGNLEFTIGDVTGDSAVDNKDVEYLLQYTLFPESYPVTQNVDFDYSGTVDNKDVEYLLWHTLFPSAYPL